MPRRVPRPATSAIEDTLQRVGSISALAKHYRVSFTTARKWIHQCGLADSLSEPSHVARLKQIVEDSCKRGRRKRVDADLQRILSDIGDRKLLARAIVDEFSMRYIFKRCMTWQRYVLRLTLQMCDFPPVEEVSRLVGVPWRMSFRKAKSGDTIPVWSVMIEGYRAFRVLQLTQPYLTGQKEFQANIALRAGPIGPIKNGRIHLGKEIYKRQLHSSFGLSIEHFRGKGAGI